MKRVLLEEADYLPAFDFYRKELSVTAAKINLTVDDCIHLEGSTGGCSYNERSNTYNVRITPFHIEVSHPLEILAHELVHVQQYYTGLLRDEWHRGLCWWKGKVYLEPYYFPCDTIYKTSPWEMQAYALQGRLYQKYLRSLGQ